jgi:hypothetical protein
MAFLPWTKKTSDVEGLEPLYGIALTDILDPEKTSDILRRESYYRCTQHRHKAYDFDGYMMSYGDTVDIPPGDDYIPMRRRQPSATMDLARVIVDRFTALTFGKEHFPLITVVGDPDAEDFARTLCTESKLPSKLMEARGLGGACGTSVMSWGFVDGRPTVEIHDRAWVYVIEWADYEQRKPARALKIYPFKKRVRVQKMMKEREFYCARYWDADVDVKWPEIPKEVAKTDQWLEEPHTIVRHEVGFCPVYWVQNLPNSQDDDGWSDYEEQEADFDDLDCIKSATSGGIKLNVDPTLVVHASPSQNEGVVHKGSRHAIYCEKGAKYLELAGTAMEAARKYMRDARQDELDKASCVLVDPEKMSGAGISAAAIKMRYMPMLAKCDLLREQYGAVLVEILKDMLKVARTLGEVKTDEDGERYWAPVELSPRVEEVEGEQVNMVERTPGQSSLVGLSWPPYFPATWLDRKDAIGAAKEATGGKQVLSQRTAVESISPLYDIEDVDAELDLIAEDQESQDERAGAFLGMGAPMVQKQGAEDDEEEEQDDDEKSA